MSEKIEINALVEGGRASGGPPLGPAIGPTGVPVNTVVEAINEKTSDYKGLKVPVIVTIDPVSKEFEIIVETPVTSALILRELGVQKGSGNPQDEFIGDLTWEQVFTIARMKRDSLLAANFKNAVLTVLGTASSCGATVEGMTVKELNPKIKAGEFDDVISQGEDA